MDRGALRAGRAMQPGLGAVTGTGGAQTKGAAAREPARYSGADFVLPLKEGPHQIMKSRMKPDTWSICFTGSSNSSSRLMTLAGTPTANGDAVVGDRVGARVRGRGGWGCRSLGGANGLGWRGHHRCKQVHPHNRLALRAVLRNAPATTCGGRSVATTEPAPILEQCPMTTGPSTLQGGAVGAGQATCQGWEVET